MAAALPPPWAAMLAGPRAATGWEVSADGLWVRYSGSAAAPRLFSVADDARLLDPPGGGGAPAVQQGAPWRDRCIFFADMRLHGGS